MERDNVRFYAEWVKGQAGFWNAIASGLPDSQSDTKKMMREQGNLWFDEASAWEELFPTVTPRP